MRYILFLILPVIIYASTMEDYWEAQRRSMQSYQGQFHSNIKAYRNKQEKLMQSYWKTIYKNMRQYYKIIGKKWGKENVIFSNNKNIIYYSYKNSVRKRIDLDKGKVSIEVISIYKPSAKFFNKEMQNLKKQTINDGIKKELIFKNTNISIPKKYNDINKKILPSTTIKTKDIKTKYLPNGKVVYEINKPLQKDYIVKLASYYMPKIEQCSKKYHIDKAYILAIIHTESSFNPKAIVPRVPAVGLMQLVPKTGARDAYRFLTGKDEILSINFLSDPNNNIELGSAYIYKIQNYYLRGVKKRANLYLATSTAYNAGIGSLYMGITGSSKKGKLAIKKINTLSYSSLHDILSDRKRFTNEATKYIDTVKKNMKYWIENLDKFF